MEVNREADLNSMKGFQTWIQTCACTFRGRQGGTEELTWFFSTMSFAADEAHGDDNRKKNGGKTEKWRRQPLWLGTGIAEQHCQAVRDCGAIGESTRALEANCSA